MVGIFFGFGENQSYLSLETWNVHVVWMVCTVVTQILSVTNSQILVSSSLTLEWL